jgi:hypothetical protein
MCEDRFLDLPRGHFKPAVPGAIGFLEEHAAHGRENAQYAVSASRSRTGMPVP